MLAWTSDEFSDVRARSSDASGGSSGVKMGGGSLKSGSGTSGESVHERVSEWVELEVELVTKKGNECLDLSLIQLQ